MNKERLYIGVDIGGMSIKTGIVSKKGNIISKTKIPTIKNISYKDTVKSICIQIDELIKKNNIKFLDIFGIGIGCPGAINRDKGIVNSWDNNNWENIPLKEEFEKHFNKKIIIGNDADCAALAESKFGAAQKFNNSILITIGTGVGSGIVINNELFVGNNIRGTELGHTVIRKDGRKCACGRKGCLEMYASTTALINDTKLEMKKNHNSSMWKYCNYDIKNVDGTTSFECAKIGDKSAQKVINNFISYLGEGIGNFINILRPDVVVIGGGISAQGDNLIKPLEDYVKKITYIGLDEYPLKILAAKLGNDAGIIGAASLIM